MGFNCFYSAEDPKKNKIKKCMKIPHDKITLSEIDEIYIKLKEIYLYNCHGVV